MADDALVDQLVLRVAALTGQFTGIPDRIAGLEQRAVAAHSGDHTGGVIAQDARAQIGGAHVAAHAVVHRVDRHGAHFDQQVGAGGHRRGRFEIDQ